jgi:hypothetical protein
MTAPKQRTDTGLSISGRARTYPAVKCSWTDMGVTHRIPVESFQTLCRIFTPRVLKDGEGLAFSYDVVTCLQCLGMRWR